MGWGVHIPQIKGHASVASLPSTPIDLLHLFGFILSQPFPLVSIHARSSSQTNSGVGPFVGPTVGTNVGSLELVGTIDALGLIDGDDVG